MPTYQYACTACGEKLEAVQSFTDAALTECPACGGALRKVFSAVGVVFKGSGFYKTDSRKSPSGGEKSEAKAGSAERSDAGGGSDGAKTNSTNGGPASDKPSPGKTSESAPASSGSGSGSGSGGKTSSSTGSSGSSSSGSGSSGSSGSGSKAPAAKTA